MQREKISDKQLGKLRRPNLFIIGAMKAGTSSLYQYLGAHPDIFMSPVKEPMHFSREENWSGGFEHYLELFAEAKDEIYLGEGSTEYSKRPFRKGVAQRLYDFNPSSKIVYIMRDPFGRLVSQYKHMVQSGEESRKLSEALGARSDYVTNSYYAYQLRPYLELFGCDAVFTGTSEMLRKSTALFCQQLFRWLKVDEGFMPPNIHQKFHISPSRVENLDTRDFRGKLAAFLKRYPLIKRLRPSFAKEWIGRQIPRKTIVDFQSAEFQAEVDKARWMVGPVLREWVEELSELTGCSYDMWPTMHVLKECNGSSAEKFWLPKLSDA